MTIERRAEAYDMAHVLFLDIVGYSLQPIERQRDLLSRLQDLVRQTPDFQQARQDELISLPTGDGMALAFLRDPLAPVRCAMDLARLIAGAGDLPIRMGVHSGPVQIHADIREQANIVGGGINIAQRVMDCGDAGHVLVSRAVAETLAQLSQWRDLLHDLGEHPMKHGVMVHLFNLYGDDAGNPSIPSKLSIAPRANRVPLDDRPSLAVLPFANMNSDPADEYFSDGLSEDIINALSEVPGLKVIARTSVFAFKGRNEDIRRIGESLGVSNLLEGGVRRAVTRIRVNAQLVRAADGVQLWSRRFDRELTDVFAVQDEIAGAIIAALRVKLAPETGSLRRHEPNLAAHDAWLRGLYVDRKHEPENFPEVERFFRQAIGLDPHWAEPHGMLADRYLTTAVLGLRPLNDGIALARSEARRALELRAGDPTAHAILGAIAVLHDRNWTEGERNFRLALASGSVPPVVYSLHGLYYLAPLGLFEEAIEALDQAIALDPLNRWWRARRLVILILAGNYKDAIADALASIDSGKGDHLDHWAVSFGHFLTGRPETALKSAEEGYRLAPWHPGLAGILAGLLSLCGEEERSGRILAAVRPGTISSCMTMYHVLRSEPERAIEHYERDVEESHPVTMQFAHAEFLAPLRSTARWARVAKIMNLPDSKLVAAAAASVSPSGFGMAPPPKGFTETGS